MPLARTAPRHCGRRLSFRRLGYRLASRRHTSDSDPRILDNNNCTGFQCLCCLGNYHSKPLAQTTLTSQSEPQQRNARTGGAPEGDDLAEIEIKPYDNPPVFSRTSKDAVIG
jgi:hypothetical protein